MNNVRINIHFIILAILATLWSLSLYFYHHPAILNYLQWLKITIIITVIIILELFYFIFALADVQFKKYKISSLILFSIFIIGSILAIFFDYLRVEKYLIQFSPQSATFLLLVFMYFSLGLAFLLEYSFKTKITLHLFALYVLVAFVILITFSAFLYIFFPSIRGKSMYPWIGPIFTVLLICFSLIGYYLIKEIQRRKEAENLAQEWEKLAQAKDQLVLSLQHHLRTPLTPIKGYLERILEGAYGREENMLIKEKLIEIKKLVDTLYSIMESLIDVQELKIGKKILKLEECDIKELLEDIIEELKPQAEQKGLYLRYEHSNSKNEKKQILKVDRRMIREAIWNLIDNGIKDTNKGGVTIESQTKNGKLQIKISDTGIGMEKEEIDYFLQGKLFERGQEAKKLYGPGRGIGLSLAIEFIKAHQGKIWAESEGWGKGTNFWIELPLHIKD